MNEGKNENAMSAEGRSAKGRIQVSGQGIGENTADLVTERAQEIAEIENRPGNPTAADYERAKVELNVPVRDRRGFEEFDRIEEPGSRDPLEPQERVQRHSSDRGGPRDENELAAQATEEGVEDAEHDRMLEARRESQIANEELE